MPRFANCAQVHWQNGYRVLMRFQCGSRMMKAIRQLVMGELVVKLHGMRKHLQRHSRSVNVQ